MQGLIFFIILTEANFIYLYGDNYQDWILYN